MQQQNKREDLVTLACLHTAAEYLFGINTRKFPGGWKVFNEKNPSFRSTLEEDVWQEEEQNTASVTWTYVNL